jgi:hypothetical protein
MKISTRTVSKLATLVAVAAGVAFIGSSATVAAPVVNSSSLVVMAPATWKGTVTNKAGEPAAGVKVEIRAPVERTGEMAAPRGVKSVTTDKDGKFTIGGLQAGTYFWSAGKRRSEDGFNRGMLKIADGETKEMDIKLK